MPRKNISFLSPAAVWWLQAASIRLPEGTLRHSKTAPNCVPKPCSNLPTKSAYRPFWIPRKYIFFCLLQLLFGGSKLQASGLQNGPFATAKQHLIPDGRTSPRIAPKKSPTSLLKPIENDDFGYFCLLLLKKCCSPTKTPVSCRCCCYCYCYTPLLLLVCSSAAAAALLAAGCCCYKPLLLLVC